MAKWERFASDFFFIKLYHHIIRVIKFMHVLWKSVYMSLEARKVQFQGYFTQYIFSIKSPISSCKDLVTESIILQEHIKMWYMSYSYYFVWFLCYLLYLLGLVPCSLVPPTLSPFKEISVQFWTLSSPRRRMFLFYYNMNNSNVMIPKAEFCL